MGELGKLVVREPKPRSADQPQSPMLRTDTRELEPEALFQGCDPAQFKFNTTAELEDLTEFVGQDRALEAVQFGVGIRRQGFNLFLLGPAGIGKYASIRSFLEKRAEGEPTPDDWCYINNFESAEKPRALKLPPGRGRPLRDDMHQLVDTLRSAIPSAFETDSYRARKQVIEQEIKERQERPLGKYSRRRARKTLF